MQFWGWYKMTAFPLGLLALAVILALSARAVAATATCSVAELYCQYAISSKDAIADSMDRLIQANPGNDIVVRKTKTTP